MDLQILWEAVLAPFGSADYQLGSPASKYCLEDENDKSLQPDSGSDSDADAGNLAPDGFLTPRLSDYLALTDAGGGVSLFLRYRGIPFYSGRIYF